MAETVTISKRKYNEFMRYKHIHQAKDKFSFDQVFGIGSGKLKGQEVKGSIREEW